MRYDDNYVLWKDSAATFYKKVKYSSLFEKPMVSFSVGGEARLEYADFHHEDWGRGGLYRNSFLLQRYGIYTDLHWGRRVRLFVHFRSALENGRKDGPRSIDEDKLNFQNLFADVIILKNVKRSVMLRTGRQELNYGSGRLISVRDGPNLRLYFTGFKLLYVSSRVYADAFVLATDAVNTGVLDNQLSTRPGLWGIYSTLFLSGKVNLDAYYLGTQRSNAVFEEGIANELRHTHGVRLWKTGSSFVYNVEAAWQWGRFGHGNIYAWTASAEAGYVFKKLKGKPSVNIRHDYISGDRRGGDGNLETFNPLYPKGGYFAYNPQLGPVNLIDIHPYVTARLSKRITIQTDVVFNWRFSSADGLYRATGSFSIPGTGSDKRYIGTSYQTCIEAGINKFITFNTGAQYFRTGAFINEIIQNSKDGIFFNSRLDVKF